MRITAILLSLVLIASASAQPRVVGHVSQEDVREITAAIRALTQDRIVAIRATSSGGRERTDRVGVQTATDRSSAGGQYLLQRVGTTWKIVGQSRWTHTMPYPDDARKRWPRVARPAEISESDYSVIKAVVAKETRDEIRSIKVTRTTPRLAVQVHTASPHVVTEGDFTLEKIGNKWRLIDRHQIIH